LQAAARAGCKRLAVPAELVVVAPWEMMAAVRQALMDPHPLSQALVRRLLAVKAERELPRREAGSSGQRSNSGRSAKSLRPASLGRQVDLPEMGEKEVPVQLSRLRRVAALTAESVAPVFLAPRQP